MMGTHHEGGVDGIIGGTGTGTGTGTGGIEIRGRTLRKTRSRTTRSEILLGADTTVGNQ